MFNFYVVLTDCDTARLPHIVKTQSPIITKKGTNVEGPSENMALTGKQFEDFNEKKMK